MQKPTGATSLQNCDALLDAGITDAPVRLSYTTSPKAQDLDTTTGWFPYVTNTTKAQQDYMEWGLRTFFACTALLAILNTAYLYG